MTFRDRVAKIEKDVVFGVIGDLEITASLRDIQALKENPAWKGMNEALGWMLVQTRNDLETQGKQEEVTLADVAFNQGVCFALRSMMGVFDSLIAAKEMEREDKDAAGRNAPE